MTSTPERQPPSRPARPWRAPARTPGPTNPDPGTPPEEVFFAIGRIVGAHGVRGEAKMEIFTENPERLAELRRVYFNDDPTPHRLLGSRLHGRQALLTLEGVGDRDAAEALRGTVIRVSGSQMRPLEEGAFYHYQLIGLKVFTEDGAALGELADILEAGEVDVYVIRGAGGQEHLFPALREVVLEIDPAGGRMVVRPQEWEEEEPARPPREPRTARPRSPGRRRASPPS